MERFNKVKELKELLCVFAKSCRDDAEKYADIDFGLYYKGRATSYELAAKWLGEVLDEEGEKEDLTKGEE